MVNVLGAGLGFRNAMKKLLSNGKKVLIEDASFCGSVKRYISIFDKEGKHLSTRVKYYEPEVVENWNMGTKFYRKQKLVTVDNDAQGLKNTVRRDRSRWTSYEVEQKNPLREQFYTYHDKDVNLFPDKDGTTLYTVGKTRFDHTWIYQDNPLRRTAFNFDGTFNKSSKNEYVMDFQNREPVHSAYQRGVRLPYPIQ